MRGMVHRPERECAQWMTFITALPLYIHTHPITAWINWSSYLFSQCWSCSVFLPCVSTTQPTAFTPYALQPLSQVYSQSSLQSLRGHFRMEGGFVRENRHKPPLREWPFAGSHTLGIIRIYVCSSIPPPPLPCCRPISGQKGSPEHDSSLSAFDQNELCLLDSLWHFISPLCPPSLSVQHREWNV